MEDNTFDLNDLPEEVVNEILEGEVLEVAPEEIIAEEPAPVVEEVVEKPARKKKSDNEIIDELVAAVEEKTTKRAPGMYHNGRRITSTATRIGSKWTVIIDGKREKVLKSEIEYVK